MGADKYFLAGNADKSSFTTGGVYDDTLSNFGTLSGNLSGITGALFINGNADGNGGYKDRLYVYSGATTTYGLLNGFTLTGLGMSASGSIVYSTTEELHIKLGIGSDTFTARNVPTGVTASIYGGNGNDTVNVGNASNLLADIDGTLIFYGEGNSDTLNAYNSGDTADCGADPDAAWACGQLTAIGLSGLGMGSGSLSEPHIYFATQGIGGAISSSTEYMNVYLGSGADKFYVDSADVSTAIERVWRRGR